MFIRYVNAKFAQNEQTERFRVYVTDALKMIAENTANLAGGKAPSERYYRKKRKKDDRTGEQIVDDLMKFLKG